jgi:hypothetical protein
VRLEHLGLKTQNTSLPINYCWRVPPTRTASRLIAALALAVGVVGISLACYALVIKAEAEALLKDVTALTVGKSTEVDAQQFSQRHKRLFASHHCEHDFCVTSFKVENRWLSALRLEPRAELQVDFTVQNGTVTRIGAILARAMPIYPTFQASAGLVDEYAEIPPKLAPRGHYSFPTPVGKPYLRILLDSQASALQREHAFAFSFRCLVKPGWGCNLPCDYLHLAWQDWKAELRDSGFPMSDFNRSYPKNERCKP